MVILEKPIPGYSNILTTTRSMSFGINTKVNYVGAKDIPKKAHQPDKPSTHLDNLDDHHKTDKVVDHQKTDKVVGHITSKVDNHNAELLALLGMSSLTTFLVVKYVL